MATPPPTPRLPRGLYVITDPALGPDLRAAVEAALRGGARVVQYRDKSRDAARRRAEAMSLALLCRRHGACFIVNDDIELALACNADGVHLGRDDGDLAAARRRLGPGKLIGASCYDSLERARRALAAGADHLAFGAFFASPTKPQAARASLSLLRVARAYTDVPLVAIGGITADNGAALVAAGADNLAVITGVFGTPDPESSARRHAVLFSRPTAKDRP